MNHFSTLLYSISDLHIDFVQRTLLFYPAGQQADDPFLFINPDTVEQPQIIQPVKHKSRILVQSAMAQPFGYQGKGYNGSTIQNVGFKNGISVYVDFSFKGKRKGLSVF